MHSVILMRLKQVSEAKPKSERKDAIREELEICIEAGAIKVEGDVEAFVEEAMEILWPESQS